MKVPHLSESDKRAVDMLLDELAQSSLEQTGYVAASKVLNPASLQAARTVLGRLEYLEASDPAPDLVARSMAHIERAVRNGEVVSPTAQPQLGALMAARVDA